MGQLSLTHLLILAILALIFFTPSRLPELGRSFRKTIKGFKQGLNEPDEKEVTDLQLAQTSESLKKSPK